MLTSAEYTTSEVKRFPLPAFRPNASLNTATFDRDGTLWFTGQNGVFGLLDPQTGKMGVFDAPRGPGPYGIATCPDGEVYYASLAGSYVGRVVKETGETIVLVPPTANQGARRVWCDSKSHVWVAEWNAGQLAIYAEIAPDLREVVEDVILNRRPDATERLLDMAGRFKGETGAKRQVDLPGLTPRVKEEF